MSSLSTSIKDGRTPTNSESNSDDSSSNSIRRTNIISQAIIQSSSRYRWMPKSQRCIQKLSSTQQQQLYEFLKENLDNQEIEKEENDSNSSSSTEDEKINVCDEELVLLQQQLDTAVEMQERLTEKELFLKTRLDKYQNQLRNLELQWNQKTQNNNNSSNNNNTKTDEDEDNSSITILHQLRKAKLDQFRQKLHLIQQQYQQSTVENHNLEHQIQSIQQRQLELKRMTQECTFVLQSLEYINHHNKNDDDDDNVDPPPAVADATTAAAVPVVPKEVELSTFTSARTVVDVNNEYYDCEIQTSNDKPNNNNDNDEDHNNDDNGRPFLDSDDCCKKHDGNKSSQGQYYDADDACGV